MSSTSGQGWRTAQLLRGWEDGGVNRTERLYAMAEELRRAGTTGRTSRQLATRFEVSERTIKRDVLALQQAGTPVWAQPGPGGGYVLDSAATLPPVNFTPAQAVAVAVALAGGRGAPFTADGAAAVAKIFDVLDPESRRLTAEIGARLWVNDEPEGAVPGPAAGAREVEEALRRRVVMVLDYTDASGVSTRRRVEPMMMALAYDGWWYLIAWCRKRDAVRWFRWDRVRDAHLTAERAPARDLAEIGEFPSWTTRMRPVSPPVAGSSR